MPLPRWYLVGQKAAASVQSGLVWSSTRSARLCQQSLRGGVPLGTPPPTSLGNPHYTALLLAATVVVCSLRALGLVRVGPCATVAQLAAGCILPYRFCLPPYSAMMPQGFLSPLRPPPLIQSPCSGTAACHAPRELCVVLCSLGVLGTAVAREHCRTARQSTSCIAYHGKAGRPRPGASRKGNPQPGLPPGTGSRPGCTFMQASLHCIEHRILCGGGL